MNEAGSSRDFRSALAASLVRRSMFLMITNLVSPMGERLSRSISLRICSILIVPSSLIMCWSRMLSLIWLAKACAIVNLPVCSGPMISSA